METKETLLNITQENMAEAEFMSANFIDKEIKNRAFINTLGAEAAINYLASNEINVDDLRNIHSIKRIIEKTNIADIILPNIHIDVRVVFDNDVIFIPKSHYDLGITPDTYMVLKFNDNFETIEFLGYFEPKIINKENCNDEFYFVDASDLSSPDNFISFVKNFDSNTEQNISENEILRGRELSILASDDEITFDEYKEFLQLLKSSTVLRDSILEYDNFETLAGSVASFIKNGESPAKENSSEMNKTQEMELSEDLPLNNADISLNDDPNGDSLIDDDNFNTAADENTTDVVDSGEALDIGVSNEAMELAGMAGDSFGDIGNDTSGMDIGSSDFELDTATDETNMDVDLFDNIDSIDTGFEEENNNSEPQESQEITKNQDIQNDNDDFENLNLDDSINLDGDLEDLDMNSNDLADWDAGQELEQNNEGNDTMEIPTEAATEMEESLSLEGDDLLDGDLDISTDDLLSLDEEETETSEDAALPDISEEETESEGEEKSEESGENKAKNELEEVSNLTDGMEDIASFMSDNAPKSSFEEYDLDADDNSAKTGFEKDITNPSDAEGFDFADLELESSDLNENVSQQNAQQDNAEDELYDFASITELTGEPQDSQEETETNEEVQLSDFNELAEMASEEPAEINNSNPEEVVITDEFLNNSVVIENSTVISDKDFEPGEILLDINKTSLPEFGDNEIGDLYDNPENAPQSGLNNSVRIARNGFNLSSISPKYGILGLFLIIVTAGIILFSVAKVMNKPQEEPQPVTGSLNPESKVNENAQEPINVNPDNVVMNDNDGTQVQRNKRQAVNEQGNTPEAIAQNRPPKPIPATSFLTIKKLTWEVPDYVSYNAEFRQFFQSSGKSLRTALSSDLLLATDYTYSNLIKLSITFDKTGKFTDAKIISSSGSADVDKIVLQSVNQTLNILKAPSSLENNENTTVILKIYL